MEKRVFTKTELYTLLKHACPECPYKLKDFEYVKSRSVVKLYLRYGRDDYSVFSECYGVQTVVHKKVYTDMETGESEMILVKKYGYYTSQAHKERGWSEYPDFVGKTYGFYLCEN